MPPLRLPPLPNVSVWPKLFPRSKPEELSTGIREASKRILPASRTLANKIVRGLGIRENEVVIDSYAALGLMTRSLLTGGDDTTTPADWEKVAAEGVQVPRAGKVRRRNSGQFDFPPWPMDAVDPDPAPAAAGYTAPPTRIPRCVVAMDMTVSQLSRGLGFNPDLAPPGGWDYNLPQPAEDLDKYAPGRRHTGLGGEHPVYQSQLEERLRISSSTPYAWPAVPAVLAHPLVWPSLEPYDTSKEGPAATLRPWDAPPPPITLFSTIPVSVGGDQLVSQWISSAAGMGNAGREWIWKYGRVRLALLCHVNLYDRIMAHPGETINCKLSVMARALFHLRPIPPCHHVPDVDKSSTLTHTDLREAGPRGKSQRNTRPAIPPTFDVTQTALGDFFPLPRGKSGSKDLDQPLVRPRLLGIEMIPRVDSPIRADQRDAWEYILRRAFVRESQPIGDMIPTFAFGAENLVPKFEQSTAHSPYAGDPVNCNEPIRNLSVEQWARIVDVFDNWAFRPEILTLDNRVELEDRDTEIGQG